MRDPRTHWGENTHRCLKRDDLRMMTRKINWPSQNPESWLYWYPTEQSEPATWQLKKGVSALLTNSKEISHRYPPGVLRHSSPAPHLFVVRHSLMSAVDQNEYFKDQRSKAELAIALSIPWFVSEWTLNGSALSSHGVLKLAFVTSEWNMFGNLNHSEKSHFFGSHL